MTATETPTITPTHFAPKPPRPVRGDPTMRPDVDIMGVQRGAHKDGAHICPQYKFKVPGGKQEDGTPLWGWNDVKAAYCANCGCRDIDHVIIRDWTSEQLEADKAAYKKQGEKERQMIKKGPSLYSEKPAAADATALNPDATVSRALAKEPVQPMQMFELEPGVPDPLAINAYRDAERERDARLQAERTEKQLAAAREEAATARKAAVVDVSDGGATQQSENDAFKAEIERMVREQVAKEKLDAMAKAQPATGVLSIDQMLTSLGLTQYIEAFKEEGMEMSVLVSLAKSEDGKLAVDEALKELGVKSVGHRLKIFAALQE